MDHVDREVFNRRGSSLGPGFITMKDYVQHSVFHFTLAKKKHDPKRLQSRPKHIKIHKKTYIEALKIKTKSGGGGGGGGA